MTDLQAWAHRYAVHGWPVFILTADKIPYANCRPCKKDHTTPGQGEACECLLCHGFYAATLDHDRIDAMFKAHPDAPYLAVRTGAPSGLVVVDFDIETWDPDGFFPDRDDPAVKTMSKLDEARLLPGTVMARTPRGGIHMLYRHPGGHIMTKVGAFGKGCHVDVKADGGYFIVAPSYSPKHDRAYQWSGNGEFDHELPEFHPAIAARLRPAPPAPPPDPTRAKHHGGARTRMEALLQTVIDAPEGERNSVLYWASCKAGEMIRDGLIDHYTARMALSVADVRAGDRGPALVRTILSGLARGSQGVSR